ncbi:hypothetical protein [uncultured Polaribacter sp.]|uniref:hypothetical protein n=1 Tax=uncultured Polaribacter sp. TaxID=174711 RepID=UPI00262E5BB3|nr:hypothetical protein [uncultured Polaribacter sp.]
MEKAIIVASGKADIGKSLTLSKLGKMLNPSLSITRKDYQICFDYKNIKIGLQTFGDTEFYVKNGLTDFLKEDCDLIIIASKGFGKTVTAIENFAGANDYRVIWTTPYRVWDGSITTDDIKRYSASHLFQMVDDVISNII